VFGFGRWEELGWVRLIDWELYQPVVSSYPHQEAMPPGVGVVEKSFQD
jgi:hypothetical protein